MMAETVEQLVVDNLLGVLRRAGVNGVEEDDVAVQPRTRKLPWAWVMFEETGRTDNGTNHTHITLLASVMVVFEAKVTSEATRIARKLKAGIERVVMEDPQRGLTNPRTEVKTSTLGASVDNLWLVDVPVEIVFQHIFGDPYSEGA